MERADDLIADQFLARSADDPPIAHRVINDRGRESRAGI